MTETQEKYYKEIMMYHKRMGKWPSMGMIADLLGLDRSTVTATINRMIRDGHVKPENAWEWGKVKRIMICD
jgi:Mn-dependent DtxR family transcriptional regulator